MRMRLLVPWVRILVLAQGLPMLPQNDRPGPPDGRPEATVQKNDGSISRRRKTIKSYGDVAQQRFFIADTKIIPVSRAFVCHTINTHLSQTIFKTPAQKKQAR